MAWINISAFFQLFSKQFPTPFSQNCRRRVHRSRKESKTEEKKKLIFSVKPLVFAPKKSRCSAVVTPFFLRRTFVPIDGPRVVQGRTFSESTTKSVILPFFRSIKENGNDVESPLSPNPRHLRLRSHYGREDNKKLVMSRKKCIFALSIKYLLTMKKNYTHNFLRLAAFLMMLLFTVGCNKEKDETQQMVIENAEHVMDAVNRIFETSESADAMSTHLTDIKAMENVEDAWRDGDAICLKIRNGGIIVWQYYTGGEAQYKTNEYKPLLAKGKGAGFHGKNESLCEEKSVCIINPLYNDETLGLVDEFNGIEDWFKEAGYKTKIVKGEEVTPQFLIESMPTYGVVIISTHGGYYRDGQHWLRTGMKWETALNSIDFFEEWKLDNYRLFRMQGESVHYLGVSEGFLDKSIKESFPHNGVMYLNVCHAFEGHNNLWHIFERKGLGCMIGFNNNLPVRVARPALFSFFDNMLNEGYTVSEACEKVNDVVNAVVTDLNMLCYPEKSNIILVEKSDFGLFSVSATKKVKFAPGNLAESGRVFVSHQWEYGGYFGWGTGNNPGNTSTEWQDYSDFYDWGDYIEGGWRTLSIEEWNYLIWDRESAQAKRGAAYVSNRWGFILLPDDWEKPTGCSFEPDSYDGTNNNYSYAQWKVMEEAGAVFLPLAGARECGTVEGQGEFGFYWSSTPYSVDGLEVGAYYIGLRGGAAIQVYEKTLGCSVRLVRDN